MTKGVSDFKWNLHVCCILFLFRKLLLKFSLMYSSSILQPLIKFVIKNETYQKMLACTWNLALFYFCNQFPNECSMDKRSNKIALYLKVDLAFTSSRSLWSLQCTTQCHNQSVEASKLFKLNIIVSKNNFITWNRPKIIYIECGLLITVYIDQLYFIWYLTPLINLVIIVNCIVAYSTESF